ncbi:MULTISPECIES: c-type cytochrome [Methylophaga]|uniref:Cytochrome c domain-containing protein n=1 Tax=Methylophaga marina TaxID=45495 RepID=A0ABP3D6F1_9GAMM|nr:MULTISPECIES: c-type cytochrome [Methylophaga]MAX52632.1 cytochrome C [Methylophaga sp.]BDZ74685.1 hypothetical protein GCM10025856_24040 [Methylophaga marina]
MRFSHFVIAGVVLLLSLVVHAEPRNVALLASACAACHGTNGHSQGGTPSLAGLNKHYFIQQMLAFKNGQRDGTVMMQHAAGYSEEEIRALAHYFSNQK